MANKTLIAVAVIAVIIVVAIAAVCVYVFVLDREKPVGTYFEYEVSGTIGITVIDGTMRSTTVSETSKTYKFETESNIYETTLGVRTPMSVGKETQVISKDQLGKGETGVKQDTPITITTVWGPKIVDVYVTSTPTSTMTRYIGTDDGVPYRMTFSAPEYIMTYDLVATNMF